MATVSFPLHSIVEFMGSKEAARVEKILKKSNMSKNGFRMSTTTATGTPQFISEDRLIFNYEEVELGNINKQILDGIEAIKATNSSFKVIEFKLHTPCTVMNELIATINNLLARNANTVEELHICYSSLFTRKQASQEDLLPVRDNMVLIDFTQSKSYKKLRKLTLRIPFVFAQTILTPSLESLSIQALDIQELTNWTNELGCLSTFELLPSNEPMVRTVATLQELQGSSIQQLLCSCSPTIQTLHLEGIINAFPHDVGFPRLQAVSMRPACLATVKHFEDNRKRLALDLCLKNLGIRAGNMKVDMNNNLIHCNGLIPMLNKLSIPRCLGLSLNESSMSALSILTDLNHGVILLKFNSINVDFEYMVRWRLTKTLYPVFVICNERRSTLVSVLIVHKDELMNIGSTYDDYIIRGRHIQSQTASRAVYAKGSLYNPRTTKPDMKGWELNSGSLCYIYEMWMFPTFSNRIPSNSTAIGLWLQLSEEQREAYHSIGQGYTKRRPWWL